MIINLLLYVLIGLSFCCFFRVVFGPSIADRMVAIDIMGTLAVGLTAILAVITKRSFLIDVALAWIFLSFIGTLALAKYLSHKTLDE